MMCLTRYQTLGRGVCWVRDIGTGWTRGSNYECLLLKWHSSQPHSDVSGHLHQYPQSIGSCGADSYPQNDKGTAQNSDITQSVTVERRRYFISSEGRAISPYSKIERQNEGLLAMQSSTALLGIDDHLSDSDKICGVFLQKLKGSAVIEDALTQTGVILTQETIDKVLKRANLGGQALLTFFRWAGKQPNCQHSLNSYNNMLHGLGRRKYFNHMEEFLQQMSTEGRQPTLKTLDIVMTRYIKAKQITKAVQTFDRMEEFGLTAATASLNTVLHRLCQENHPSSAHSLFKKMRKRISADSNTYSILIGGWSRQGRMKEVYQTLDDMIGQGFKPDCITYNYVLDGFFKAGRSKEAAKLLNSMSVKGCLPNTINYNTMIRNLCSGGNLDEGLKYYNEMLGKGCKPNITTYKLLIVQFLKDRRVADALDTFSLMLERGFIPEVGTVDSFIEPLCKFGPPHAALQFYEQMKQVGCNPNLKTYKLLLMRLGRFGRWKKMLELWNEMQKSGWTSDIEAYTYLVNGFCNGRKLEEATHFMGEALSKGFCPGRIICSKLINNLIRAKKVQQAYNLFVKIKDARRIDKIKRIWRSKGWQY